MAKRKGVIIVIKITDEMVQAATDVLNDSGAVEVPTQSNRAIVRGMLEAAFSKIVVSSQVAPSNGK